MRCFVYKLPFTTNNAWPSDGIKLDQKLSEQHYCHKPMKIREEGWDEPNFFIGINIVLSRERKAICLNCDCLLKIKAASEKCRRLWGSINRSDEQHSGKHCRDGSETASFSPLPSYWLLIASSLGGMFLKEVDNVIINKIITAKQYFLSRRGGICPLSSKLNWSGGFLWCNRITVGSLG